MTSTSYFIRKESNTMANVLPVRELFSFEAKELLTGLKTDLTILFEDEVKLELPYK